MTVGQLLSHSAGLRAETRRAVVGADAGLIARRPGRVVARRGRRQVPARHAGTTTPTSATRCSARCSPRKHGQPWYDVIARDLLRPLGMSRTTTRPQRPHATGYAVHPYADALLAEPEHDAERDGARRAALDDGRRPGQRSPGSWPATCRHARGRDAGRDARADRDHRHRPGSPGRPATDSACSCGTSDGQRYYGHTGSMPGFVGDHADHRRAGRRHGDRDLQLDHRVQPRRSAPTCSASWPTASPTVRPSGRRPQVGRGPARPARQLVLGTSAVHAPAVGRRARADQGRRGWPRPPVPPRRRRRLERPRRLSGRRAARARDRAGRLGDRPGHRLVHLHQDALRPGRAECPAASTPLAGRPHLPARAAG